MNTNGEFSDGTWVIDWETGCIKAVDAIYREPIETAIARVYIHDIMERPDDEGIANARLIMAAPEMYSLLVDICRIDDMKAEASTSKNDPLFMKALVAQEGALNMIRELLGRVDGKEANHG